MTDFKVGDRVVITRYPEKGWNGTKGTVLSIGGVGDYVRVELDQQLGQYKTALFAEREIAPEPYEPRDGDEITISLRGKVSGPAAGGWDLTSDGVNFWQQDFDDYEVTVHERGPEPKPKLPTTPGSVVMRVNETGGSYPLVLTGGRWVATTMADGTGLPTHHLADLPHEVIFDAGAR